MPEMRIPAARPTTNMSSINPIFFILNPPESFPANSAAQQ
jgi:hypothetical protein